MGASRRRPKSSAQLWLLEPLATLDPELGLGLKKKGERKDASSSAFQSSTQLSFRQAFDVRRRPTTDPSAIRLVIAQTVKDFTKQGAAHQFLAREFGRLGDDIERALQRLPKWPADGSLFLEFEERLHALMSAQEYC